MQVSQKNLRYRPRRDLVEFVKEHHTLSPSKLQNIILRERNKDVTPEAITMWFSRHPEIHEHLKHEILQEELLELEVSETIFANGTFEELPSVKAWLDYLRGVRRLKERTIAGLKNMLKQVCTGRFRFLKIDLVEASKWCYKHPDRLTYKDAVKFLSTIEKRDVDLCAFAKTLKSFLLFRGIGEANNIVVGKPRGFGKFKDLYVKMETLIKMLQWIQQTFGYEPYLIDKIMFRKAARINATVEARIENIDEERRILTVYEKGTKRKYGKKGKEVPIYLDVQIYQEIQTIIGNRKSGKIFNMTAREMGDLNRAAIEKFCPEILEKYGHVSPNHFWRHMFAQHMLRLTNWKYTIVAKLGNWTPQALRESYGEPPDESVEEWRGLYNIEI